MGFVFRILGPLEVENAPALGGPKPRTLLARLLLEPNRVVAYDELIDALWPDDTPEQPRHTLQVYVSSLRRALGQDRIQAHRSGYAVQAATDELDLLRFEQLRAEGTERLRKGDPEGAQRCLAEALSLWRGPALAEVQPALEPERARLDEARRLTVEEHVEAGLVLGRHAELTSELEALVRRHPTRERPRRQLMLALYRSGRQADALEVYRETRRTLIEELGLEPSPELRELQAAILRQDPGLMVEPAELRARRRLPAPATPLVGRRAEVGEICDLLRDEARLVTLTGVGGSGKTRVAIQVAYDLADRFADGVAFVGLSALRDPELVLPEIAATLEVTNARDPQVALAEHLRARSQLLVIDNFEQVDEAAPALASLLGEAEALKLLVTSRHPLRVYGEHEFPIAPLGLDEEAVPLFLQRARATGRPVQASEDVREICRRLDCLPLGIELVAARARELAPAEMRAVLSSRLELASVGPRDLPARQQTLRATIEWSYALLGDVEQRLFATLGVFVGGCTEEASAAVCAGDPETLASLVEKSLLVYQDDRFTMLETIREYAIERLAEEYDEGAVRRRHAEHFVGLGVQAKPELKGAEVTAWLERLEAEHDNLRAALDWSLQHEADWFVRVVDALFLFWYIRGHFREGLRWYEKACTVADADPSARADVLKLGGGLAYSCREFALARTLVDEALLLYRELADTGNSARALTLRGLIATSEGEHAEAVALLEDSAALARETGDEAVVSFALTNLSHVSLAAGDNERAYAASSEALEMHRRIPPERENPSELGAVLGNLGLAELLQGRFDEASFHLAESLSLRLRLEDAHGIASAFTSLAAIAAENGAFRRAGRLLGAADAVCERTDAELEPIDAELYERTAAVARSDLTDEGFAAAREEGRSLRLEEAAAVALEGMETSGRAGASG